MKRRSFLLQAALAATTAKSARAARRQNPPSAQKIIATKDAAYFLGKIEPVLPGKITHVSDATGGRWALMIQELRPKPKPDSLPNTIFGEEKLWLYDAHRHTVTLLHRAQDDPTTKTYHHIEKIDWFPSSGSALVFMSTDRADPPFSERRLGLVDAERKRFRFVPLPFDEPTVQNVWGTDAMLFLGHNKGKEETTLACFFRPDGTFSPVVTLTPGNWQPTGPSLYGLSVDKQSAIVCIVADEPGTRKIIKQWYALRLKDTQVTRLPGEPKSYLASDLLYTASTQPALLDFKIEEKTKLTGTEGRTAQTTALWLEAVLPRPDKFYVRGLITPAMSGSATLLADLSAALFVHEDALYAVPITPLDRATFEKRARGWAIENARFIGEELLAFARSQGKNLPSDPRRIQELSHRFREDNDPLADLVYTYKGTNDLTQIQKPDTISLGYIAAPGGRVMLYADGHVEWKPTP